MTSCTSRCTLMAGEPSSRVSRVTSETSASAATASPFSISGITSAVTMASGMRSGARYAAMASRRSASRRGGLGLLDGQREGGGDGARVIDALGPVALQHLRQVAAVLREAPAHAPGMGAGDGERQRQAAEVLGELGRRRAGFGRAFRGAARLRHQEFEGGRLAEHVQGQLARAAVPILPAAGDEHMRAAARGEPLDAGGVFGVVVDEEPGFAGRRLREKIERGVCRRLAVGDGVEAGDEARAEFDQVVEQG